MDHAKLLDVLASLPVSQSILPRAVCFATSRPASHAICSFIDSSGYASGPIRKCLFIDYIIKVKYDNAKHRSQSEKDTVTCSTVHTQNMVMFSTDLISISPVRKYFCLWPLLFAT